MTDTLPERINVTKVITYTVPEVIKLIAEDNDCEPEDVTLADVIEKIEGYAKDDFACGWGHEANVRDLIFTNENGEEL